MRSSYVYLYVAAQFVSLIGSPAYAQQAAPPPAVLVQPAELRSMTKQAEFVGRAEALEKVDLRARVQGFLGARLFKDGDEVRNARSSSRSRRSRSKPPSTSAKPSSPPPRRP